MPKMLQVDVLFNTHMMHVRISPISFGRLTINSHLVDLLPREPHRFAYLSILYYRINVKPPGMFK